MRYNPPDVKSRVEEGLVEEGIVERDEPETYFEGRPRFVSDQTAFIRWSTEIEKVDNIIDDKFLARNRYRVIDINKILPLGFIDNPKSIKLFRLRRMNMGHEKDAGLFDLAEETVMDNLADYQTTRGIRGNYQNALITQRREWRDRTENASKKGLFGRLIRSRNDEENLKSNLEEVY